jgi:hypothetical protein
MVRFVEREKVHGRTLVGPGRVCCAKIARIGVGVRWVLIRGGVSGRVTVGSCKNGCATICMRRNCVLVCVLGVE